MRNQTLQKQSFLRENSIAAGLLEGKATEKQFWHGFRCGNAQNGSVLQRRLPERCEPMKRGVLIHAEGFPLQIPKRGKLPVEQRHSAD